MTKKTWINDIKLLLYKRKYKEKEVWKVSKPRRMAEKSNYLQRNNNYNNIENGKYGREEGIYL